MAIDFDSITTDELLAGEELPEVEEEVQEEPTETSEEVVEEPVEQEEEIIEEEEEVEEPIDDTEEEEEVEEPDFSVVGEVAQQFGLEIEEDTPDTLESINKVVREASTKMAEQQMSQVWEAFPDVKEYAEYRANGGDPDSFRENYLSANSYSDLNVENTDHQKMLVKEQMREQGFDDSDIQDEINELSDANLLQNKAKRAQKYLTKKQEKKKQKLIQQQKQKAQQERQKIQQEWNQIENTIEESNQFKGLKIPETEKSDFYKWMREPQQDGKTQREKQLQNVDLETHLMIDYLLYKGGNLSDLVDNLATTKNAETLANKLKGNKRQTKSRQFNDNNGTADVSDIESIDFAL